MSEKRWLCTDCDDRFKHPREDYRCPMCGGARLIQVDYPSSEELIRSDRSAWRDHQ